MATNKIMLYERGKWPDGPPVARIKNILSNAPVWATLDGHTGLPVRVTDMKFAKGILLVNSIAGWRTPSAVWYWVTESPLPTGETKYSYPLTQGQDAA